MSWFKKISWHYGEKLPPNLPDDLPVYEILNIESAMPFSVAETDEVDVTVEPFEGDKAKLVVRSYHFPDRFSEEPEIWEPLEEEQIDLNETLGKVRIRASQLAREYTKALSEASEIPPGSLLP